VLIRKYLDHLPLYRIEQISERHGVKIARSTLAEWVGRLLTRPKNTLAKRHIRQRDAGNNSSRAQAWLVAFA